MAEHQIKIENFAYNPAGLTIKPGDKVTWTNLDSGMVHTATSSSGAAGDFDTGDIATNEMKSVVFDMVSSGDDIPYTCTHHGFMSGKIKVS